MGAMQEEITPLLEFFGKYETIEFGKNKYYVTTYKGLELVIAYSKIGKVNASLTASTLIEKFGATKLLFSGVAGAVNPSLKIGDLIVATKLAQHDLDITAFGHPHGFVPEGSVFVETDSSLMALAQKVALDKKIVLQKGIMQQAINLSVMSRKKSGLKRPLMLMRLKWKVLQLLSFVTPLGYHFLFSVRLVMQQIWMRVLVLMSFLIVQQK